MVTYHVFLFRSINMLSCIINQELIRDIQMGAKCVENQECVEDYGIRRLRGKTSILVFS